MRFRWSLVLSCCLFLLSSLSALAVDKPDIPLAVTHDNLHPAGELKDGVLTIHLTIANAAWHPYAEDGPWLPTQSFQEEGKAPSIPGPMIRVTEGTEIHAYVKNSSRFLPLRVHGLHTRPGDPKDVLVVGPGETKEVRFKSGAAGSYYYWATTLTDGTSDVDARLMEDTNLHGAFIVDRPGARNEDRVFVIGGWYQWLAPFYFTHGSRELITVNGKAWPHTTRLTYSSGETIHWRVLNPTYSEHPMHMHGAYFRVNGVGDAEHEEMYASDQQRQVVTQYMPEGSTMDMSWTPANSGNWLFHCHLAAHIDPDNAKAVSAAMGEPPASDHDGMQAHADHAMSGMSGLVVGITVLPNPKVVNASTKERDVRKMTLTLRERSASPNEHKCASIELKDSSGTRATAEKEEMGPPLILHRDEPTEITVVNHLTQPTSIHWHGLEIESYYDGVPGFGGDGKQVTPAIPPGTSFVVRITAPRAGTFIYHTHWHDMEQLTGGVYGALIVLDSTQKYDPETDKIFLISQQGTDDEKSPALLDGSASPAGQQWRVGTKYHLRLINISPNRTGMKMQLLDGDKPVQWFAVAKDGADLPVSQRKQQEAKQRVTVGETYDFEYVPQQPGKLTMEAFDFGGRLSVTLPIEVK